MGRFLVLAREQPLRALRQKNRDSPCRRAASAGSRDHLERLTSIDPARPVSFAQGGDNTAMQRSDVTSVAQSRRAFLAMRAQIRRFWQGHWLLVFPSVSASRSFPKDRKRRMPLSGAHSGDPSVRVHKLLEVAAEVEPRRVLSPMSVPAANDLIALPGRCSICVLDGAGLAGEWLRLARFPAMALQPLSSPGARRATIPRGTRKCLKRHPSPSFGPSPPRPR